MFRLRCRRRLRLRLNLLFVDEGIALDCDYLLRFFFLDLLLLFPSALFENFGNLDIHLFRCLFRLEVFAEGLLYFRHQFVRYLCIRIGVNLNPLSMQEFHKVGEADVELPHYFV